MLWAILRNRFAGMPRPEPRPFDGPFPPQAVLGPTAYAGSCAASVLTPLPPLLRSASFTIANNWTYPLFAPRNQARLTGHSHRTRESARNAKKAATQRFRSLRSLRSFAAPPPVDVCPAKNSLEIRPAVLLRSGVNRDGPSGRSRPRRRPDARWQFAFCVPRGPVRKTGLLFTCYREKTTRLVPACDRSNARILRSVSQGPRESTACGTPSSDGGNPFVLAVPGTCRECGQFRFVRLFAASEEGSPLAKVVPCRSCPNNALCGPERSTK